MAWFLIFISNFDGLYVEKMHVSWRHNNRIQIFNGDLPQLMLAIKLCVSFPYRTRYSGSSSGGPVAHKNLMASSFLKIILKHKIFPARTANYTVWLKNSNKLRLEISMNRLKIDEIKRRRYGQNPRSSHAQPSRCSVERPIAFILDQKHGLLQNDAVPARNRGCHAVDGSTRSKANRLSMCILPSGHKASKIVHNDAPTAAIHNHPHIHHRSQRDESQLRQRVLMEAVTIVSGWMYEEPCFIDPSVYGEGNARHIDEVRQRLRAFRAGISSSVMEQLAAAARRVEEAIAPPPPALPAAAAAATVDTASVPSSSHGEPSTPSTVAVATLTSSGRQPRVHSTLNLPTSGSARVCIPLESIHHTGGGATSKPSTKNYTPHGSNHSQHGHADRTLSNGGHFDITSISKASCKLSAPSTHTHILSPALSVRRTVVYFTTEHPRHISPGLHHLTESFSSGPKGQPWLPTRVGSNEVQDCGTIVGAHRREQVVREEHEAFHGGNGDHYSYSHHCRHSNRRHPVPAQFCESEERNHAYKGYSALAPDVDLDNSLLNCRGALVRPPRALPPTPPRDRDSLEEVCTISTVRHPIWDTPDVLKTSTQYLSLDL